MKRRGVSYPMAIQVRDDGTEIRVDAKNFTEANRPWNTRRFVDHETGVYEPQQLFPDLSVAGVRDTAR